jgi:hypothetical protein
LAPRLGIQKAQRLVCRQMAWRRAHPRDGFASQFSMAAAHEASASPRPRVLNVKPSNGSREYLPSPAISRALQVLGWHEGSAFFAALALLRADSDQLRAPSLVLAPREPPPAGADETSSSATISPPMRPHKSLPKFDIAWVHSCHASFWRYAQNTHAHTPPFRSRLARKLPPPAPACEPVSWL